MQINWSNFLKNSNGKESSDRLMLILSFPFATGAMIWMGSVEGLGVYLAAYGGVAMNNKWAERGYARGNADMVETDIDYDSNSERGRAGVSPGKSGLRKGKARAF